MSRLVVAVLLIILARGVLAWSMNGITGLFGPLIVGIKPTRRGPIWKAE